MNVLCENIMNEIDAIMSRSTHIYNGNWSDCETLSVGFGRTVASCRCFEVKTNGSLGPVHIGIVEVIFRDNSEVLTSVKSAGKHVFVCSRPSRGSRSYNFEFLTNDCGWMSDIKGLGMAAREGRL